MGKTGPTLTRCFLRLSCSCRLSLSLSLSSENADTLPAHRLHVRSCRQLRCPRPCFGLQAGDAPPAMALVPAGGPAQMLGQEAVIRAAARSREGRHRARPGHLRRPRSLARQKAARAALASAGAVIVGQEPRHRGSGGTRSRTCPRGRVTGTRSDIRAGFAGTAGGAGGWARGLAGARTRQILAFQTLRPTRFRG